MKILKLITLFVFSFFAHNLLAQLPNLPIDFESPTLDYTSFGFGGPGGAAILSEVIVNPDASGENTSATVLRINKPEGSYDWAGASLPLGEVVDFSSNTLIAIKVWSGSIGTPIHVKFEESMNGANASELTVSTTQASAWETLVFDIGSTSTFNLNHQYDLVSIFPDFGNFGINGGAEFYFDDIEFYNPVVGSDQPTIPIDFESPTIDYASFGFGGPGGAGILSEVIANPDASGQNISTNVFRINKPEGSYDWAGVSIPLGSAVDFSSNSLIAIKVWSGAVGIPIHVKFEESMNGANASELSVTTTQAASWETLVFDIGSTSTFDLNHQYDLISIFPDFGNFGINGGADFYFDDIEFYNPVVNSDKPIIPIDFESTSLSYDWDGYGGPNFDPLVGEVIDNPFMDAQNSSGRVLHISKPEGSYDWAGATMQLGEIIDMSDGAVFTVKIYAPMSGLPIKFILQDTMGNQADVISTTSLANQWETMTFDLTQGNYDPNLAYKTVGFEPNIGAAGATGTADFYFDEIQKDVGPLVELPSIPVDFESNALIYNLFGFGDANFMEVNTEIIDNPAVSGVNPSSRVWFIEKPEGAQPWSGASMPLQNIVDLSNSTIFSMKVWSPAAGKSILLKLEDNTSPPNGSGGPSIFSEIEQTTTVANQWQTLFFDMSDFNDFDPSHQYNQLSVFPDYNEFGPAGGANYYFDDINYSMGVGISEVDLEKVNLNIYPNPTDKNVLLELDLPVAGKVNLNVINLLGKKVKSESMGNLSIGKHQKEISMNDLPTGNYYIIIRLDETFIGSEKIIKQ